MNKFLSAKEFSIIDTNARSNKRATSLLVVGGDSKYIEHALSCQRETHEVVMTRNSVNIPPQVRMG